MKFKEKIKNKSAFQIFSGIVLIVLVLILNGFLSFIKLGFDFSKLSTSEYWVNFALMTASELVVMFGMYLIQKIKDLNSSKITDLQKEINSKREIVYGMDKVTQAEDWLREVYNYKEKLVIFENKVKHTFESLRYREPHKDEKDYEKKLEKYNKQKDKKDVLLKQLEFIKKDKQRLDYIVQKDIDKAEILEKELNDSDYLFKNVNIKYREVYWGNLLSDIEETARKESSAFFSEKKELSKKFIQFISVGLMTSSFVSALVYPAFNAVGWEFVINMVVNLIILTFFMLRGVLLSKNLILGKYYNALEKRKSIYNKMLKDLDISKVIIKKGPKDEDMG